MTYGDKLACTAAYVDANPFFEMVIRAYETCVTSPSLSPGFLDVPHVVALRQGITALRKPGIDT